MNLLKRIWLYLHKTNEVKVKDSALSAANYFIDLSLSQGIPLKPLKLMKLVYIAHGFMLASSGRTFLDSRFDRVEAWKYGPVIPSVYHSFKQYGNTPIDKKTVVFVSEDADNGNADIQTPLLNDEYAKRVCNFVWKRYKRFSDSDLVYVLHGAGTAWAKVYEDGKNNIIPDEMTRLYYRGLIRVLNEEAKNGKN